MEPFFKFYQQMRESLIEEATESSMAKRIAEENIFSFLSKQEILDRFEWYKNNGVAPIKRFDRKGNEIAIKDEEFAEFLPYIFKYLDADVADRVREEHADDPKLSKRVAKHYNGHSPRGLDKLKEDSSQFSAFFRDWLDYQNKRDFPLTKSLNQDAPNFYEAYIKLQEYVKSASGGDKKASADDVDATMPTGMTFDKEYDGGNLRGYWWKNIGDVCTMDSQVKTEWMAMTVNRAGDEDHNWCVSAERYAKQYGEPDGSGKFKYPFYLLRKKNDDGTFTPYVMFNGGKLEAKDWYDKPVSEDIARYTGEAMGSEKLEEIVSARGDVVEG